MARSDNAIHNNAIYKSKNKVSLSLTPTFSSLWYKGSCDDVDVSTVHHNLICSLCNL